MKYKFVYRPENNDYRLSEVQPKFTFSPRVFAENFFANSTDQSENGGLKPISNAPQNDDVRDDNMEKMLRFCCGDDDIAKNQATDKNYPNLTNVTPSTATANALKNLMFSQDGYLSSALTYAYQGWNWSRKDQALGHYLVGLSKNDNAVFDALGSIVLAFGGDPNFSTSNGRNWTTQNLILTQNRDRFLQNVISNERRAILNLNNAISVTENESLKTFLTALKDDKEKIVVDLENFLS